MDMLDESQQIMEALRAECKKLREQNEQLKEDNFELRRVSSLTYAAILLGSVFIYYIT
jgi:hypothetical protein